MEATQSGQVSRSAADVYEEFFVPAIFLEWAAPVVEAAAVAKGQRVLDVACGTGVVAREAARRAAPVGMVVGIDCNEGMLDVARRTCPDVEWRLGRAESLPFGDGEFDAVVSQFGLMFFEDRVAALREMWRVLNRGGRLAVAVWDTLERTPGYAAMTALLEKLFGDQVAAGLRAPYVLGDPDGLLALFAEAGIATARLETRNGQAHFPSLEAWVHTDIKGWTLADMIDDAQFDTLRREAAATLARFTRPDGSVRFPAPAHIVTAVRP
jgi:ubiquinone/menaquinone biosynthesis C-methylase UbiE